MSALEFRERTIQFGRASHLNGILTLPKQLASDPSAIFIMTNAGIISRTGASRIHVELARQISKLGVASLRFDLSGLGDSDIPDSNENIQKIVDQDLLDAIQLLQKQFPDSALIGFGLCSGAYDFFHCLEMGGDLSGVVLLDLASYYINKSYLIRHYANRFKQLASWKNLATKPLHTFSTLRQRVDIITQADQDQFEVEDAQIGVRPILKRNRFKSILNYALEKETDLLFIYTGGLAEYYNYEDQFADTFPDQCKTDKINWEYQPNSDHMFSRKIYRDRLFSLIEEWLEQQKFVIC